LCDKFSGSINGQPLRPLGLMQFLPALLIANCLRYCFICDSWRLSVAGASADWCQVHSHCWLSNIPQSVMKDQPNLVQMPIWENICCSSLWIFLAIRACYAVYEASYGW